MHRLMIVDDSSVIRKVAKRILTGMNFLVVEAGDYNEAKGMCEAELPQIVVVDSGMPNALELMAAIRGMEGGKDVRIFYCMVESEFKQMMTGKRAGADEFLLKPFDRKLLTTAFGRYSEAA